MPLSDKNSDKIDTETDSVQSWEWQDASKEAEELGPAGVEASKTWTTLQDTRESGMPAATDAAAAAAAPGLECQHVCACLRNRCIVRLQAALGAARCSHVKRPWGTLERGWCKT